MRRLEATYEDMCNGEATPEEYRLAEEARQERAEARADCPECGGGLSVDGNCHNHGRHE